MIYHHSLPVTILISHQLFYSNAILFMKSGHVTQAVKLCDWRWLNDFFSSWSHSSLLAKVIVVLQEKKKSEKKLKTHFGWKDVKQKNLLARNSLFISSWLFEKPFVIVTLM